MLELYTYLFFGLSLDLHLYLFSLNYLTGNSFGLARILIINDGLQFQHLVRAVNSEFVPIEKPVVLGCTDIMC